MDSDILIQAWRDYPIDNFPSVWESLEKLGENEIVTMSEMILGEIEYGGDDLSKWVKDRESILVTHNNDEIDQNIAYLVNKYQNFGISTGKNGGDPFVIAVAMAHNCSVVTNEKRSGSMNGPKIPDVCLAENIAFKRFVEIIKEQGLRF